ncbi:hypothetical protein L0F51_00220 [Afifella sp. H1R]|uniref:hypothetical protein n=1 Tax=Afifella sp. H1R TaxID=2908841 RepID=UPI001F1A6F04|nr:hypothetical protein [Afifella sp. H1R]MCF1502189.1 hypothetical protein [Afifella sp. H1R]
MLCKVLKDFPFSRDGFTTVSAKAGTSPDVPDRLVAGLRREGYLSCVGDKSLDATAENKAVLSAEEQQVMPAFENKAEGSSSVSAAGDESDDVGSTQQASPEPPVADDARNFEARETGRGWFAIGSLAVDGSWVEIEPLRKMRESDAKTFNEMSPADQAEYVKAELESE